MLFLQAAAFNNVLNRTAPYEKHFFFFFGKEAFGNAQILLLRVVTHTKKELSHLKFNFHHGLLPNG